MQPSRSSSHGGVPGGHPLPHDLMPAPLLVDFRDRLLDIRSPCPILDLACGNGHNGLYLAAAGASVQLVDRDAHRLQNVRALSVQLGLDVDIRCMDLEHPEPPDLPPNGYAAILVFRYLHRPLMPLLREAIVPGGMLVYETFTTKQAHLGRPRNPDYLLKAGELGRWFGDWQSMHAFEGVLPQPDRAVAQLVCRKPVNV